MNARPSDRRSICTVRRLLEAVDRSIAANREVEKARAALERESSRKLRLVGVAEDRAEVPAGQVR